MSKSPESKAIIWVARIWSLVSFGFVLLFLFGEGLNGHGARPTQGEWIGLALWPGGVVLGLAIAWFRAKLGGVIAIASLIAFYLWSLWDRGGFLRVHISCWLRPRGFCFSCPRFLRGCGRSKRCGQFDPLAVRFLFGLPVAGGFFPGRLRPNFCQSLTTQFVALLPLPSLLPRAREILRGLRFAVLLVST